MKTNLFIAALSLVVLAGCSGEDEIDTLVAKSDNAINFTTYVGKQTKAGTALAGDFGVFAYQTATDWSTDKSTATPNYMFNQKVDKDGVYTPIKYWSDKKISFIAYYPYQEINEGKFGGNYLNTSTGLPSIAFTLPTKADKDLMVSDVATDKTSGKVEFLLKHTLSKVTFTVQAPTLAEGTTISDPTIKLTNIKNSATLSFGSPSSWSDAKGTEEFTATVSTNYYMIPQDLADVKAEISYTITTTDTAVSDGKVTDSKKLTVSLATTTITSWETNKQYNYTISPTLDQVSISATADNWGEASTPAVPENN